MKKKRWNWEDVAMLALVVLIFAIIIAIIVVGIVDNREYKRDTKACIAGGYAKRIEFNETILCIGVEDGKEAVEPLEDVRARLEVN